MLDKPQSWSYSFCRMKVYLAIRWGHAESPDGPDGEDTQLLIRASSLVEASKLADAELAHLPISSPLSTRQVQPFCHRMIELGSDASIDISSRVLVGPWIGRAFFDMAPYQTWVRDDQSGEWQDAKKYY